MPRVITLTEIVAILESGDFNQLLSGIEGEHLECKSSPYQLAQDRDKMELAKDVSALANADGGIILIGVQTGREPNYQGDIIQRVGCFPQSLVDLQQYQNVISDWIIPAIPGMRFAWHESAGNSGAGITSILVPKEACLEKPFLVSKVVESVGKVIGSYIGYFERTRDNVTPMKPGQLREAFKDGRRFSELDARLGTIEEMIGKIITRQASQEAMLSSDAVLKRVQRAREALGYDGKPTFSLAAWPSQLVEFTNLFESHEVPVVRLLENPPQLRSNGFDLDTRRLSNIVEARLRRCLVPDHKLLEIWRDGVLIYTVPGDDSRLCWAMHSTPETGLRINNVALTEMVYLFCDWILKVYEHATPAPAGVKVYLELSNMNVNGRPFGLSTYRLNQYNLADGMNFIPEAFVHFETEVDRRTAEPGVIAYRLLAELYAWFGFNAADMPYVDRSGPHPKVDPAEIGRRQ